MQYETGAGEPVYVTGIEGHGEECSNNSHKPYCQQGIHQGYVTHTRPDLEGQSCEIAACRAVLKGILNFY